MKTLGFSTLFLLLHNICFAHGRISFLNPPKIIVYFYTFLCVWIAYRGFLALKDELNNEKRDYRAIIVLVLWVSAWIFPFILWLNE